MENEYGIIREVGREQPVRELLKVPHQGGTLTVSYPAFGRNSFYENLSEMQKAYTHPKTKKPMNFREATTAESISASAYEFEKLAKKDIFGPSYLQAGRIVRASEGVWVNPPKDKNGKSVLDEKVLNYFLEGAEKSNGIYLVPNGLVEGLRDFSFVPYETFEQGPREGRKFAESGLARGLEHTKDKRASNLEKVSENCPEVRVLGFDSVKEPVEKILALSNNWGFDDRLNVDGNYWFDSVRYHAFGVLE